MNNLKPRYLGILTALCLYFSCAHAAYEQQIYPSPFLQVDATWADTTIANMTLEEKLGQLFIVKSNLSNSDALLQLINTAHAGGLLIEGASLYNYVTTINRLRRANDLPLLEISTQNVSINNQYSDLSHFPSAASLSAIDNEPLKSSLYQKLLKDYEQLGINCSFAPNIHYFQKGDNTYTNLNNEVNPMAVFSRASRQIAALNERNILPILRGIKLPADSIPASTLAQEGYFSQYTPLLQEGLAGIYIEEQLFEGDSLHYQLPEFVKRHIQDHLKFNGLLIGAVSEKISFIDLLYAGADTYVVKENELSAVLKQLKHLLKSKKLKESTIDQKVKKILLAKTWLGLDKRVQAPMVHQEIQSQVRNIATTYLEDLYAQGMILGNDDKKSIPLDAMYGKTRHAVYIGQEKLRTFQNTAFQYVNFSSHLYRPKANGAINPLAFKGTKAQYLITLDNIDLSADKHRSFLKSIHQLNEDNEVAIVNFGNPLNLHLFDASIATIQLFDKNRTTEKLAAQLLFGSVAANGKMPLNVSPSLAYGHGKSTEISRLNHASPEEVGMDTETLDKIDEIVERAIQSKAMPGCQILVAKKGSIVYSKGFGYHTYDKRQRVERSDLYDIASVTKVAATTLAMMRLVEHKQVFLEQPLANQMSLYGKSNLGDIPVKNLLIHKSGLQKNMPISKYLNNREGTEGCKGYFCKEKTTEYSQKIVDDFYFNPQHKSDIWKAVNRLERPSKYRYRKFLYGDVNFYVLQKLIEEKTRMSLDEYMNEKFYKPLGLRYCLFNPLTRLPETMITPTQDDQKWRYKQLRGSVHDETAALHGGAAGNAGLFANTEDLAVLFQMLLNGGRYGGKQYLQKETIDFFTNAGHGNHRGLGFDKRELAYTIARSASMASYGHNGFTGTCVWVDPVEDLIYIFLSNRVYPDPTNNTMMRLGVRKKVHQVIYDAIQSPGKEETLFVNLEGTK